MPKGSHMLGNKNWLGRKHTLESRKKMSDHMKGKKLSEEHKRKISVYHKGRPRPESRLEKNYNWKGEDACYSTKHDWIHRNMGKATICQNPNCIYPRPYVGYKNKFMLKAKRFEWANISKEYKRDMSDYIQLCVSCHQKWDGGSIIIDLTKL